MNTWEKVWFVAGLCTALSTLLSLCLILRHLRNYTQPKLQRHIVRILLMVPIYSIDSWLSLQYKEASLYFDLARDAYEAYVLYQFFCLLIAFINTYQYDDLHDSRLEDELDPDSIESMRRVRDREWEVSEDRVVALLESKPMSDHPWPTCCFPPFKPGAKFLLLSKRCILQFVVIKPLLAVLAAFLETKGWYGDGDFSPSKGYLWITIIDNISITVSMYFLVLFYHVTQKELKPFNPVSKFLCIKLVIMFAFWQGIIMALLGWFGVLNEHNVDLGKDWKSEEEIGTALQNLIICIEMLFVAIAHSWAYSYESYKSPSWTDWIPCYCCLCCCCCCCKVCGNFTHVLSQRDVLEDGVEVLGLDNIARKLEEGLESEEARWKNRGSRQSGSAGAIPSSPSPSPSTSTRTMVAGGSKNASTSASVSVN